MKKDIRKLKVEGVYIAIVREQSNSGKHNWYVYLINDNDFAIENVLITLKGYGNLNEKYIFLPEALTEKYIKFIDQVGMEGVLHC